MATADSGSTCSTQATRWIADVCDGHSDRLIPITLVDFADVDWTVAELERMRGEEAGSSTPSSSRSTASRLVHPDFERIWATANDLGMLLQIHIGGAQPIQNPGWFRMGDDVSFNTLTRIAQSQAHSGVQTGLAAMIHAGLFERYPRLGAVTAELDIRWVPNWLEILDGILVDEKWQNHGYLPMDYSYPLLPSEYARAARRVHATGHADSDAAQAPRHHDGPGDGRLLDRLLSLRGNRKGRTVVV